MFKSHLGEESVQAVDFLLLLHVGVVLGDTLERELLHQVDLVRVVHVLLDELVDGARKGGRVEQDLTVGRQEADHVVEHVLEVLREELVGLVHHEHAALVHDGQTLLHQVEYAAGRGDHHVHLLLQAHDVLLEVGAARGGHHLAAHVLGHFDADLAGLEGELARRHDDQRLDLVLGRVNALQYGNDVGARLAGAVLGASENVAAGERDWDARLLDGRRILPALLEDAHEQLALQTVVLELVALGGRHIGGLHALVLGGQVELRFPASLVRSSFRFRFQLIQYLLVLCCDLGCMDA